MNFNKGVQKIMVFIVMCSMMLGSVFATNDGNGNGRFKDVETDHWAKDSIEQMVKYGVISGYDDGTFKPNQSVKRDEFSTMMVKSLNLTVNWDSNSSFSDMEDDYWAVPYVETAKYYLTGYRSGNSVMFKPQSHAVREDMAVALVKALGYEDASYDEKSLNVFSDAEKISSNLKKYVAIALEKGIMSGSTLGSKRYFNPTNAITRAESAVLLNQVISNEKIVFEEVKVTFEDDDSSELDQIVASDNIKPELTINETDGKLKLSWNEIGHSNLNGYKVVASKSDGTPAYPENGYKVYITDRSKTYEYVKPGDSYNGGDFGGKFVPGETYYFSITALYNDEKVAGNVVRYKVPGTAEVEIEEGYVTPQLKVTETDGKLKLTWNEINSSKLNGYKVVASLSDSTPAYPENGYKVWITDKTKTSEYVYDGNSYNSGDFSKFESGKTYYFSITAVYNDKKVPGNVVRFTMP